MTKNQNKISTNFHRTVLSNQNDTTLETDELASDLISAIKEFEETTAKITLTHQSHDTKRSNVEEIQTSSRTEEKGPIDYFNRTKESLRHVPQIEHDTNNHDQKLRASNQDGNSELAEAYVKIPVQQLINTFEKQMRSIIKQKVNENIQLNMDGSATTTSNKISSSSHVSQEHRNGFVGKENEIRATNTQFSTVTPRQSTDIESIQQQQSFDRTERQISNSIDEQYQWSTQSQSTTSTTVHQSQYEEKSIESANMRFNSNEKQQDENIDGGKTLTKKKYNFSYPVLHLLCRWCQTFCFLLTILLLP